jgi:hypothetical protein
MLLGITAAPVIGITGAPLGSPTVASMCTRWMTEVTTWLTMPDRLSQRGDALYDSWVRIGDAIVATPSVTHEDLLAKSRLLTVWMQHQVEPDSEGLAQSIFADIQRRGGLLS